MLDGARTYLLPEESKEIVPSKVISITPELITEFNIHCREERDQYDDFQKKRQKEKSISPFASPLPKLKRSDSAPTQSFNTQIQSYNRSLSDKTLSSEERCIQCPSLNCGEYLHIRPTQFWDSKIVKLQCPSCDSIFHKPSELFQISSCSVHFTVLVPSKNYNDVCWGYCCFNFD